MKKKPLLCVVGCLIYVPLFTYMLMDTKDVLVSILLTAILGTFAAMGPFCGVMERSRRWQREDVVKMLDGELRLQILEEKWKLEDLQSRLRDPEGRFAAAIKGCQENIDKLDRAQVILHESDLDEVAKQGEIVDVVLRASKETVQSRPAHTRQRH